VIGWPGLIPGPAPPPGLPIRGEELAEPARVDDDDFGVFESAKPAPLEHEGGRRTGRLDEE
jgi:hypothetical protein